MKAMLWTGGDAHRRDAVLTVEIQYNNQFAAYWEPGYCGCPDCHPIVGWGDTEMEAVLDYWDKWEEKYGTQ
jgi:hypothetical protein